jgi:hypothetical protein
MKFSTFVATIAMVAVASSKNVASAYVSPLQYEGYDCSQLQNENARLAGRVSELGGTLDKKASNDNLKMGVGLVVFWPALLFLDGDGPQASEYARMKGEHDAVQQVATRKNCITAMAPPAPAAAPASSTASNSPPTP